MYDERLLRNLYIEPKDEGIMGTFLSIMNEPLREAEPPQPPKKKNKRNTIESRNIQLMFLSRSTKRPAVHDEKTVVRRGTKFHIPRNRHFCLTLKETPQIIYH